MVTSGLIEGPEGGCGECTVEGLPERPESDKRRSGWGCDTKGKVESRSMFTGEHRRSPGGAMTDKQGDGRSLVVPLLGVVDGGHYTESEACLAVDGGAELRAAIMVCALEDAWAVRSGW